MSHQLLLSNRTLWVGDCSGFSEGSDSYMRHLLQSHHLQISTFNQQLSSPARGNSSSSGSIDPAALHPDSTELVRTQPLPMMGGEEIGVMGDCDQGHPVSNEGSHRGKGVEEWGCHYIQKKSLRGLLVHLLGT